MRGMAADVKIVIIGAGALGKCLAAVLAKSVSVMLYERNPLTRQTLLKGWFYLRENGHTRKVRVKSIGSLRELRGQEIDVLIVATKVMDVRGAIQEATGLCPKYVFLPQNGIFDIGWIHRLIKRTQICRGAITMACQDINCDHVILHDRGNVYFGGDGAPWLADFFRRVGFKAKACHDTAGAVWAKLIFSAVMNPLPVITGQGYGVLKKDRRIWGLVRQAIKEGRMVAKALGIRLAFDPLTLIDRVRHGDLAGIKHRGSIRGDISAGRSTEIDFITGALVRQAHRKGISTPALDSILHQAKLAGA